MRKKGRRNMMDKKKKNKIDEIADNEKEKTDVL